MSPTYGAISRPAWQRCLAIGGVGTTVGLFMLGAFSGGSTSGFGSIKAVQQLAVGRQAEARSMHAGALSFFGHARETTSSSSSCEVLENTYALYTEMQHDYCVRKFTGAAPRPDTRITEFKGPKGEMKFVVYSSGDAVSDWIMKYKDWETDLLSHFMRAMTEVESRTHTPLNELVFMDIGANIGTLTTYMQAAGYRVISFEPMPANEDIIRSNLCLNDPKQERAVLFNKGLGNKPGLCQIYSVDGNMGNGNVYCDGTKPGRNPLDERPMHLRGQMEVVTLDSMITCEGTVPFTVGALKMDVEGYEALVIKGGLNFLKASKVPFVFMEWVNPTAPKSDEALQSILDTFYGLGYKSSCGGWFYDDLTTFTLEQTRGCDSMYFSLYA